MRSPHFSALTRGRPTARVVWVNRSAWGYRILLDCGHLLDTRSTRKVGAPVNCPRRGCGHGPL